jgi:hypothetical protein
VLPAHAAVSGAHRVIDDAHWWVFVSQMPEQQVPPPAQDPPNAVQVTLTLPSGANLMTDPSNPVVPSGFAFAPSPAIVASVRAPSSLAVASSLVAPS